MYSQHTSENPKSSRTWVTTSSRRKTKQRTGPTAVKPAAWVCGRHEGLTIPDSWGPSGTETVGPGQRREGTVTASSGTPRGRGRPVRPTGGGRVPMSRSTRIKVVRWTRSSSPYSIPTGVSSCSRGADGRPSCPRPTKTSAVTADTGSPGPTRPTVGTSAGGDTRACDTRTSGGPSRASTSRGCLSKRGVVSAGGCAWTTLSRRRVGRQDETSGLRVPFLGSHPSTSCAVSRSPYVRSIQTQESWRLPLNVLQWRGTGRFVADETFGGFGSEVDLVFLFPLLLQKERKNGKNFYSPKE